MSADAGKRVLDRSGRPVASLVCPIPPLATGVATYALRVLEYTHDVISWTVWYPSGGDPSLLPGDVQSFRIEPDGRIPEEPRLFMMGNSPECFEVAMMLESAGGAAVFHETVMHHALRFCFLSGGRPDLYRRELQFEYGPGAGSVEKLLSRGNRPESEYDLLLKRYPLLGRLLHSTTMAVCLNPAAAEAIGARIPGRPVLTVSHPLSPVPSPLPEVDAPQGRYLVGMAGGGHPGRNPGVFLDAVADLRESLGDVRAVFIGGGWPGDLPEWASCTGRLDEPFYQAWLRRLDAAADLRYPDCGETSGSLLELLRAAVPCIVTASGSFLHLPADTVVRLPAPPSGRACAHALRGLLGNKPLSARLGSSAAAWASAQGSPERAKAEWSKVVSAIPARTGRGERERRSLSAAWHEPLPGMTRQMGPGPVTWRFRQQQTVDAPAPGLDAWVTAWGDGQVSGTPLGESPAVIRVRGGRLELSGSGEIAQVMWLPEAGER